MIIRRGYRFGGHLGLHEPFLAKIADQVVEHYQEAYPELARNRMIILNTITQEEQQFQDTPGKRHPAPGRPAGKTGILRRTHPAGR